MPLLKPVPPPSVLQAQKGGLADFINPDDDLLRVFLDAHPARHEVQHVFSLGIEDISKDGTTLKEPHPVGWRFMAADQASGLAGAAHVGEALGIAPRLSGISRTPRLASMFYLIDQFENLKEVREVYQGAEPYDLLVLRIPGLVEAFWLKSRSRSPHADWIIPFYTRIRGWDSSPPPSTGRPPDPLTALTLIDFLKEVFRRGVEPRLNFTAQEGLDAPPVTQPAIPAKRAAARRAVTELTRAKRAATKRRLTKRK